MGRNGVENPIKLFLLMRLVGDKHEKNNSDNYLEYQASMKGHY